MLSEKEKDYMIRLMDHKSKVSSLMGEFAKRIIDRGSRHDNSKLLYPEFQEFAKNVGELEKLQFGTKEYDEAKASVNKAVGHHYEYNDHHPEHFSELFPLFRMNLFQIVEMFCDWLVASEANKNGFGGSLEYCANKYQMSNELQKILQNTAEALDKS